MRARAPFVLPGLGVHGNQARDAHSMRLPRLCERACRLALGPGQHGEGAHGEYPAGQEGAARAGERQQAFAEEGTGGHTRVEGRRVGHRAALLTTLTTPASTSQLAARHTLAPSTVSSHLTALRAAGLLDARRQGYYVLYRRTALGDALAAGG
ncbi:ArsR/SmtB family transcription factor [Streptomyces sp. NBC_01530]|uniref:ArsR/SmtB family transcription factor n=1 Tax=Streptomyces sp. NBC_01530 TaxID=2903895 RepID=UPI00386B980D